MMVIMTLKHSYMKFSIFLDGVWRVVLSGPLRNGRHVNRGLDPAVALARIVTFKMLEDKALVLA